VSSAISVLLCQAGKHLFPRDLKSMQHGDISVAIGVFDAAICELTSLREEGAVPGGLDEACLIESRLRLDCPTATAGSGFLTPGQALLSHQDIPDPPPTIASPGAVSHVSSF